MSATSGNGVVGSHGFDLSAETSSLPQPGLATRGLHSDDVRAGWGDEGRYHYHNTEQNYAIAPDLQVTTTYRRPHPESTLGKHLGEVGEAGLNWQEPPSHIYSRYTSDTRSRSEKVLSGLLDANAITYASGLAASYSAVLHYAPSVIAIRKGYFGVHAGIEIYQRAHQVRIIDLDDEYPTLPKETRGNGDQTPKGGLLVWVESPLNPTGEARDLRHYAARTHAAGGVMAVDSTFAPLQDVFACGADMVMHSATKYFGGHSDLLAGIIAVKSKAEWDQLFLDRSHIGNMPGNMEAWLLLRSLRSLQVRWRQQSSTALLLANWLQTLVPSADAPAASDVVDNALTNAGLVQRVWHASFQPRQDADPSPNPRFAEGKDFDPRNQFTAGFPATFAFRLKDKHVAEYLPHRATYFSAATSLGGVESLLEHRLGADPSEDPALVRISVGLEDFADLRADLRAALKSFL